MLVVTPVIRLAQLGDAERIGAIQVRAWQATYRGVMPDAYLDELDVDDRAAYWRGQVLALLPTQRLKVIVDDGVVVGFAAVGPEHDGRAAGVGELYAINLDPRVWGRGLGRALLRDVTAELAGLGYREAVLWVVPQNDRARRFYESEQWRDDHVGRDDEVFGVVVPEMRYRRRLPTSGPGVSAADAKTTTRRIYQRRTLDRQRHAVGVRRVRLNGGVLWPRSVCLELSRQWWR